MSFNGVNAIEKSFNNYLKTWVHASIVGYDNNNNYIKNVKISFLQRSVCY